MHNNNDYQEATCTHREFILLESLLNARGQSVSCNSLAKLAGVSLTVLTKTLEKLNQQGFKIEVTQNNGYRLQEEPCTLHPALVRYYQKKTTTKMEVLHFPTIDSTNDEAERQYINGRKSPFAVTSSCQTQGRGRLGRQWHSVSAENIYLSVLIEPNIPSTKLQSFTLWSGIYICRILQKLTPETPLKIKWPNDLHCDGRKFAGMLTEAKMGSEGPHSLIFGIGINVNSNPLDYPGELSSSATSLYAISGKEVSLNLLTVYVLQAILHAYETCLSDEICETLTEAWAPLDALNGRTVTVLYGNKTLSGIADGIDASGALLLLQPDHTTLTVRAGEVTLKK